MSKRFVDRGVKNKNNPKKPKYTSPVTYEIDFPIREDRLQQKEVAEMFDTTVQTIINWRKSGKIPFYNIGKKIIYSRSQLIKIASKNQQLVKA